MINATRSWPHEGSFPVVLSPRRTKLLSVNPVLRWTPVTGATKYSVIVRGPLPKSDQNKAHVPHPWETRVSGTEIAYPSTAPRLVPGVDYKLLVQAGDRSSAQEPGLGLGFSIMVPKERKAVEKQQRQIEQMGLPEGPTQFLIANLYAAYGLNAEAIQRLEAISPTFKVAAVMRLLGELYLDIGLTREAEADYLKALDMAQEQKDVEGQMLSHFALAGIYGKGLGNEKVARQHLDATLELAERMGDQQMLGRARKFLAELKPDGV